MSESRWLHDPHTGREVRLAPCREARPHDDGDSSGECPFCEGNDERTPPEVDRVGDGAGGWLARTVPNLYPAFDGDDGVCEVVIESPQHVERFADLPSENAVVAVRQWASRVAHWSDDPRFDFQCFFKNEGSRAGASLRHVHSQVIALKQAPAEGAHEWMLGDAWRQCSADRLVLEQGGLAAFCPPAPRLPGATWIAATEQGPDFADRFHSPSESELLAELLGALARSLPGLGIDGYNLMLFQPPATLRKQKPGLWLIELLPRAVSLAGFELATGAYINSFSPELAAEKFREAIAASPSVA